MAHGYHCPEKPFSVTIIYFHWQMYEGEQPRAMNSLKHGYLHKHLLVKYVPIPDTDIDTTLLPLMTPAPFGLNAVGATALRP